MILILVMSTFVGILDVFGLTMFYPLLTLVLDTSTNDPAENMGNMGFIIHGFQAVGLPLTLVSVVVIMLTFFGIKGIFKFFEGYFRVIYQQYFMRKNRTRLVHLLNELKYESFLKMDSGKVQNTLTGEVIRVNQAFNSYMLVLQQTIMLLVYVIFAFIANTQFAFFLVTGAILSNFLVSRIYKRIKKWSIKLTDMNSQYHGLISQEVSNFKYLKATGIIRQYSRKLIHGIQDIETSNRKMGMLYSIVQAVREPILLFVLFAVILLELLILNGSAELILLSILFFYRALISAMRMQLDWTSYLQLSGSVENHKNFEKELESGGQDLPVSNKMTIQQSSDSHLIVQFENVSLTLSDKKILNNINLAIPIRQTIAFVGPSGAGKTSLLNLVCGLIQPTSGTIKISKDLNAFRNQIGYITQEPVIFSDTIYNNVTLWAEKTPENLARFANVVNKADLNEFINQISTGSDTILGTDGMNISGGQKQRIAIARELFRDIEILIMDEATSSLDSETERSIQRQIERLQGEYTILIVAHRLSTIKHADQVIMLQNGEIIGQGTFDELSENSKDFRTMIKMQQL
jgi:ABC-type multidrug transport system fused ATPase/permease subunit